MNVYLDKLEIHGFKSFPDKTVIKFHRGITVIVGPNGCGKSNVVDAVLWVLGEQRIKNLRGENTEDLIFNGNPSKKPLGMTEVAAHFVQNDEPVYIARKYFRTGDSKYILNEKYCRHKDIRDTLFDMHLGERNYFIFEQGSIDRLISLKPTEKRLLIEEAAGISQYLERKKETTNKLIIAEQNLENIEILLADKETRLRDLKNQVNYVHRYRQLKKKRNDCLQSLLMRKSGSFQADFKEHKLRIEEQINREALLSGEINSLEKKLLKLEEERWRLDRQLKEGQQTVYQTEQKALSGTNEIEKIKQRQEFIEQRIGEIETARGNREEEMSGAREALAGEREILNALKKKLERGRGEYRARTGELRNLRRELEESARRDETIRSRLFQNQSQLAAFNNDIQQLNTLITRSENEIQSRKRFMEELKHQISQDEIDEARSSLETCRRELEAIDKEHRDFLERQSAQRENVETMKQELAGLRSERSSLEQQKKKYLEIRDRMSSQSRQAEEEGSGCRVQDLLKTEKKYHGILENFYFDELDAHTEITVSKAAASSQNKILLHSSPCETMPAGLSKASGFVDLVKNLFTLSNDRDTKAYLKDGVLTDTLENGIQLFVEHGVEVVTLEGETINRHGILARNRERGILSVLEDIRSIDRRLDEVLEKEKTRTEEIAKAQASLEEIDTRAQSLRQRKESQQEQQMGMKSQLDALLKAEATNRERIERSQSEIDIIHAEKQKHQTNLTSLQNKKLEMEETIAELEEEQRSLRDQIADLKNRIAEEEKNFLTSEHEVKLLEEKQRVSKQKIEELENRIQSAVTKNRADDKTIQAFRDELKQSTAKSESIHQQIGDAGKEGVRLKADLKQMETDFDHTSGEIKTINLKLTETRQKLTSARETRNELEIEFSSIKKDVSQLQNVAQNELNADLENLQISEEYSQSSIEDMETEYERLNERWQRMRDSDRLNFSAESEHDLLSKEAGFLLEQKEDVVKSIHDMQKAIKEIDEQSNSSFLTAFDQIRTNFKKNFQILFNGGEAELRLTDHEELNEIGLEIQAQPHGKKLQNLRLLSGGEKALTSLAFLFSLFEYKPSPFCVFDEVDAALDESNIRRFLTFVHNLKSKTQFLIITHNFKTMEEADYIYGISMNEPGISTIYSMEMDDKTGRPVTEAGRPPEQ